MTRAEPAGRIPGEKLLCLHGLDVEEARARLGKPQGEPLPA